MLALSVGTSMETVTGVTVAFCSHLLRAPYSASCSRRVWGPAPRDPASQTYVRAEPSLRLQGPPPPSKPQPGAQGSAPRRPLQEAPPRHTPQTSRVLPASRESVGAARTGGAPTSAVSPTRTSTSRTALPRPSPAGPKAGGTWPKPSRRVSALVLGPSRTAGRPNRDLPAWGSLRAASSTGGRSRGPACGRPEEQSGAGCLSWSPGLTVQRKTPRPPPATPRAFPRPRRPLTRRRPPRLTPTPPTPKAHAPPQAAGCPHPGCHVALPHYAINLLFMMKNYSNNIFHAINILKTSRREPLPAACPWREPACFRRGASGLRPGRAVPDRKGFRVCIPGPRERAGWRAGSRCELEVPLACQWGPSPRGVLGQAASSPPGPPVSSGPQSLALGRGCAQTLSRCPHVGAAPGSGTQELLPSRGNPSRRSPIPPPPLTASPCGAPRQPMVGRGPAARGRHSGRSRCVPSARSPPGDASIHCRARCVHRGSVLPNVCLSSLDDTSVRVGRARETRGQSHGREQTSAQNHLGSCLQRSARGGRCLGGAGFAPSPRGCPQAADRLPPTPSCHGLSVSLFQMLRADGVAPSAVWCLASSRPPGRSSCGMCGGSPGV